MMIPRRWMTTVATGLTALWLGLIGAAAAAQSQPSFLQWAPKPPLGWNSWDCFATTITEAQAKAQADAMAKLLAPYGWQYLVVDIQWYEPNAKSFDYRKNAVLTLDEFGRLWPATNRFPSSVNGAGFKPLSDYAHAKGLKFGVHLLRGIPRQAVVRNCPIQGTAYHAADIADTNSLCVWNGDMYGVDMTRPGAQEYYNSVFQAFADWGVDFVKVDDMVLPPRALPLREGRRSADLFTGDDLTNAIHLREVEALRKAIDRTGRAMLLSLSPGETPLHAGPQLATQANMWRISDDFWDEWSHLMPQFERLNQWTPYRGPGHFPDADMLPLGAIRMGKSTHFTRDEQFTLMSLWSIARSPLIFGGDMTLLDAFTLSLLTNREVLEVNQASTANRQLFRRGGLIAWTADVPGSGDKYLALFNTLNPHTNGAGIAVPARLSELGLSGTCQVRDLWQQKDLGEFQTEFAPEIRGHGAGLYRVRGAAARPPAAAAEDIPARAYLFSYFINNGEDGLRLAWSHDGYRWEALNNGRSFLRPVVGESKLMRDPCLLLGPDGTFHMVWTTSWTGKSIGYASSKDLIHWSEELAVPVMDQEPATLNCWAPEIVWDPAKAEFLVFWASTVTNRFLETAGSSEGKYNHRIYSTTTRDFKTWSPTRLYFDPGFSVIDTTLFAENGRCYLFMKDETVKPPKKHLRISTGETPDGPFGPPAPPFTTSWVEGPTVLKVADDYIVYFDCYGAHHYGAMRSQDLEHWEDVTARLSMPKGIRHGTALQVPGKIIEALRR